jgi:hypothetical protein
LKATGYSGNENDMIDYSKNYGTISQQLSAMMPPVQSTPFLLLSSLKASLKSVMLSTALVRSKKARHAIISFKRYAKNAEKANELQLNDF